MLDVPVLVEQLKRVLCCSKQHEIREESIPLSVIPHARVDTLSQTLSLETLIKYSLREAI